MLSKGFGVRINVMLFDVIVFWLLYMCCMMCEVLFYDGKLRGIDGRMKREEKSEVGRSVFVCLGVVGSCKPC